MEYLMTYGWAILIIAVVLGAIYSLGLFNAATLGPKASPGSCQVYRPNGPGTTQYINLEGTCTNELPQYVAHADGTNPPSIVTTSVLPSFSQVTVVGWINRAVTQINGGGGIASSNGCFLYWGGGGVITGSQFADWGCIPNPGPYYTLVTIPSNKWVMIAYTVDTSGNVKSYDFMNPSSVLTTASSGNVFVLPSSTWVIGGLPSTPGEINGSIADVQVYNTTLDANSLQALYLEGIGGAPINLQSLAAWWPMNGNANDYSGNGYNAAAKGNVVYTNQWLSGYTTP